MGICHLQAWAARRTRAVAVAAVGAVGVHTPEALEADSHLSRGEATLSICTGCREAVALGDVLKQRRRRVRDRRPALRGAHDWREVLGSPGPPELLLLVWMMTSVSERERRASKETDRKGEGRWSRGGLSPQLYLRRSALFCAASSLHRWLVVAHTASPPHHRLLRIRRTAPLLRPPLSRIVFRCLLLVQGWGHSFID